MSYMSKPNLSTSEKYICRGMAAISELHSISETTVILPFLNINASITLVAGDYTSLCGNSTSITADGITSLHA